MAASASASAVRPTPSGRVAPRVWGHRGAPESYTENTLQADRRAIAEGAHGLSIDARAARDGLVLVHDPTLQRTLGKNVEVAHSTVRELKRQAFPDGTRVAEVAPVVDKFHQYDLDIEIKDRMLRPDSTAERLAAVLRPRAGELRNTVVSSFDPLALRRFARAAPDVPRALLLPPSRIGAAAAMLGAKLLLRGAPLAAIHPHHSMVTPERVARWHAAGYKVNVYTVDDPAEVLRVAAAGVDSIITDRPAATLRTLRAAGYEIPPQPDRHR